MALVKEVKTELVKGFQQHDKDTGSPEVQIAILTNRITYLTEHWSDVVVGCWTISEKLKKPGIAPFWSDWVFVSSRVSESAATFVGGGRTICCPRR